MADPVIANAVRAQCIWQGPSGLPTDRFVTTWAFIRSGGGVQTGGDQAAEVAERLREFWLEPVPPGTVPVAGLIPRSVTLQGLEIRTYDLGQPVPREPVITEHVTTFGSETPVLPREVAVTLSFYSERNLPTKRGRVYIGPLTAEIISGTSPPRVSGNYRAIITQAAERLALGRGAGDEMEWAVLSQKNLTIHPITDGWVDDAFDTMRSRGAAPTARTVWPAAV